MRSDNFVQSDNLIYALDIGTRNVIGIVAKKDNDRINIIAIDKEPHAKRTMMDGQIEDINEVAKIVIQVTRRLEETIGKKLTRACVAAAGRALRTQQGHGKIQLDEPQAITADIISSLEAQAVNEAESELNADKEKRMFLVGYSATQTTLDNYPMRTILGHTGLTVETDVVATFLPSEVVESLYSVMHKAGLEVASLTLEPIAALNAAIPHDLRLLNLALVDIGAGTSDIAICKDGSVTGYTMATIAGDEVTEAIMKQYLVDYNTAEKLKADIGENETHEYTDILGLEQTVTSKELKESISEATATLVEEISERILSTNTSAPSAVFLAGGGSKLYGLQQMVAGALNMDKTRVAIAGGHFKVSAYSDEYDIVNPEYTTPIGIAVSAALGLISDSYRVMLNGEVAKLFRSGSLTALEILMMNGYTYQDLLGRNGKNLVVEINGKRRVFAGGIATLSKIKVNDENVAPSQIIHAGDRIMFVPAKPGEDMQLTVNELLKKINAAAITVNGIHMQPQELIPPNASIKVLAVANGAKENATDILETKSNTNVKNTVLSNDNKYNTNTLKSTENNLTPKQNNGDNPKLAQKDISSKVDNVLKSDNEAKKHVFNLNGKRLSLPQKETKEPYYLLDLLEHTDINFDEIHDPVQLHVNGKPGEFRQVLVNNDIVEIKCVPKNI